LSGPEVWRVLSSSAPLQGDSKWDAVYVLLGIYAFWSLVFTSALFFRQARQPPLFWP
jgi:hypothetical protein